MNQIKLKLTIRVAMALGLPIAGRRFYNERKNGISVMTGEVRTDENGQLHVRLEDGAEEPAATLKTERYAVLTNDVIDRLSEIVANTQPGDYKHAILGLIDELRPI